MNFLDMLASSTEEDLKTLDAEIEALRAIRVAIATRLYGYKTVSIAQAEQPDDEAATSAAAAAVKNNANQKLRCRLRNLISKNGPITVENAIRSVGADNEGFLELLKSVWFTKQGEMVQLTERGKQSFQTYQANLDKLKNTVGGQNNGTTTEET